MRKLIIIFTVLSFGLAGEVSHVEIPLKGEAAERSLEPSGLAWYNNHLIIMPQYVNGDSPAFYYIDKSEIINWLKGDRVGVIEPRRIGLEAPEYDSIINGFQGFEAICFTGDNAVLLMESKHENVMGGYLVKGRMNWKKKQLVLDSHYEILSPPVNIKNMAYESVLATKYGYMALFEANGANVNPNPQAEFLSKSLKKKKLKPIPSVEYRLTDVTALDKQNRFWAINFFWPGERNRLLPAEDKLAKNFTLGKTHQQLEHVERLIEFQLKRNKVILTDSPPIQLKLDEKETRNWEGIARLDDKGFLLIVDEYPRTILAFIPYPN